MIGDRTGVPSSVLLQILFLPKIELRRSSYVFVASEKRDRDLCGFPLTENEIFSLKKAAFCPHPFGKVLFLQREEIFFYSALDACAIGKHQHEHSPQCREITKFITLPNSLEGLNLKGRLNPMYIFICNVWAPRS